MKRFFAALAATVAGFAAFGPGARAQSPKASATPAAMAGKTGKKLPARDAKGRFIKASPAPSPSPKPKKALPARDAKGRFIKKTAASPAPAVPATK